MKYIQSKMSDFYKLKDDFKILKEKLSEKPLDDGITKLIEKVQDDIEDLNDSKLSVKSPKYLTASFLLFSTPIRALLIPKALRIIRIPTTISFLKSWRLSNSLPVY